jgi:IS30 family transposase
MNHFIVGQRYKFELLLQQSVSKSQIPVDFKVYISSVYREIKRNSDDCSLVYKADLAQQIKLWLNSQIISIFN